MNLKKTVILFSVGVLLVLLGTGLWFFVSRGKKIVTDKQDKDGTASSTSQGTITTTDIPEWYATDKDADGIEDTKEDELGLDKWAADTDGDGISDFVEINEFKTDPRNPDTDGDGFWDGVELESGYNPLGEGKLITSS
ncbi:MAG: hypothetical protein WCW16_04310 [Candidatus Magasanikbacteria bacterium]